MQVVDKNDIERRLLFYWSRLFSKSIKAGKDYSKLEKTIAILVLIKQAIVKRFQVVAFLYGCPLLRKWVIWTKAYSCTVKNPF